MVNLEIKKGYLENPIPYGTKVLIKKAIEDIHEQTTSGIFIPTDTINKEQLCEVVSIGPEVKQLLPGDIIVVPDYSLAKTVLIDNKEYYIMVEAETLLIVKRQNKDERLSN